MSISDDESGRFHVDIGPPEDSPIPGARYAFPQKMVKIDAVAGFCDLQLPQLDGVVVALDWVANDWHHIWGSAVMVAPGVALTAGHVIDEMRDRGFLAEAGGQLFAVSFHADRWSFGGPTASLGSMSAICPWSPWSVRQRPPGRRLPS